MDQKKLPARSKRSTAIFFAGYALDAIWIAIFVIGSQYMPLNVFGQLLFTALFINFMYFIIRQTYKIAGAKKRPNDLLADGSGKKRFEILSKFDEMAFRLLIVFPALFCYFMLESLFPREFHVVAGITFSACFIWFVARSINVIDESKDRHRPPDVP